MCDLRAVLESVETSKVREYFSRPLPDAVDDALANCLAAYERASDPERREMRSLVGSQHSFGLLAFAERMAVLAVRGHSTDRIRLGLLAVALEDYRFDSREDLMVMALLLNSARKIGADPVALFDAAADKASERVAESMRTFVRSRQNDRKLVETMGYKEVSIDGKFSYTRRRNVGADGRQTGG